MLEVGVINRVVAGDNKSILLERLKKIGQRSKAVLSGSHSRPLDTECPYAIVTFSFGYFGFLLSSTEQEAFLYTSAQSTADDDIHQVNLLVPLCSNDKEVRVEP